MSSHPQMTSRPWRVYYRGIVAVYLVALDTHQRPQVPWSRWSGPVGRFWVSGTFGLGVGLGSCIRALRPPL